MSRVEVFLDETPGETRGLIARDGRFERLLVQRADDPAQQRLGARSIGRVLRIETAIRAAFIDLGAEGPAGYLALSGSMRLTEGEAVEVEVSAEARDGKGPALKLIGPATREPGLVASGPDVRSWLQILAPGLVPVTGAAAIQASWEAEEEAMSSGLVLEDLALDLRIERTRALVAADLDWSGGASSGRSARDRANRRGLMETARLVRLKSWGGLVAVDLIGVGHDGESVAAAAKVAFGPEPGLVLGPVNRFGVLMASLPWRWTPVEQRLAGGGEAGSLRRSAQEAVRRLNHALLSDRTVAALILRCSPPEAHLAAPWLTQIGPRARLIADPAIASGQAVMEEV
ncbi:MAG: RNA-binding protein [Caulobacterales bacterium]|nr:RNA-binding protein [Caulobacterales bacterium]